MGTKEFFKEPNTETHENNKTAEIPETLVPQTTMEMAIALKFIKNMGENMAAEFIDTFLEPGDNVRIKKSILCRWH